MSSWKDNLRTIDPYVPGEQPQLKDMIKLNTNENPYPPSPKVKEVLQRFDLDTLRLYPDPDSALLVEAIAKRYNVENNQVFVGVGSDDVLAIAFMTFFNSKKPILFPDITYSFYDVWAALFNIPFERPALDDDFNLVAADYYKENGGVVIANPNAPTGIMQNEEFLRDVIEHNRDVVVIIDEAYVDFSGKSALSLTKEYDNVLIVQTFSKSRSMAGLRIGFAIAGERIIKALNDVKYSVNSYTLNRPSIELGTIAVENDSYYQEITRKVTATRERSVKALTELGFECLPSGANFIFAKHKSIPGAKIFDDLRNAGIYVRHFDAPRIDDYLRISIGTDEQMDELFKFLKENYG